MKFYRFIERLKVFFIDFKIVIAVYEEQSKTIFIIK